ncbi:NACHT domain-containing protein [Pseudomonas aeruginosa]|uniref:NACHT domain-containing protein n=1 Tax=Pseudomonas aeruginosa TaxID=287 RepID=UPI003896BBAB
MSGLADEHIPIARTFHEIEVKAKDSDESDISHWFSGTGKLRWSELLNEHRVILLSEAGAGKTAEIRHITRTLRAEGKHAFFMRIENIRPQIEEAFDEGCYEEFIDWVDSGKQGWLLLDSVDEAKLHDPRDFERAIRAIAKQLKTVLPTVHIVITGRATAWRVKTDLLLCETLFPSPLAHRVPEEGTSVGETGESATERPSGSLGSSRVFKIVALDDLHDDQIDQFLQAKNVNNIKVFKDAVARKEAWRLTTRPIDLTELIEFWKANERIGSSSELMQNSIDRRLKEHDSNRDDLLPITPDQLRKGARLLAAGATLGQSSSIVLPDIEIQIKGIQAADVLPDWTSKDVKTLLSRPIFEPGIYGAVRFHHRSVREYLTAEWLHKLIMNNASRLRVESLFFRSQYDIEVVIPTMRPVLSWLAVMDTRILERVRRVAPEVVFEGGDPSLLHKDVRIEILRQVCAELVSDSGSRSLIDSTSARRFASADLADEINALLEQYRDHETVSWFLLMMVWQGEVAGCLAQAKSFACESRDKHTRLAAISALDALEAKLELEEVRNRFLEEFPELDRSWIAELIGGLPATEPSVTWLLSAAERAAPEERYHTDSLSRVLVSHVKGWPSHLVGALAEGYYALLKTPPVDDTYLAQISIRYEWLIQPAASAISQMVLARTELCLEPEMLSLLRMIPAADKSNEHDIQPLVHSLRSDIADWPALNHAMFWHDVRECRIRNVNGRNDGLVNFHQVGIFGCLWSLQAIGFSTLCDDIISRPLPDDRLVGLSAAWTLYQAADRPGAWLKDLKRVTAGNPSLEAMLTNYLNPPEDEMAKFLQRESAWKKKAEREKSRREVQATDWKNRLRSNTESLRNPPVLGQITNGQLYLLDQMRQNSNTHTHWSDANWESLIPEFGKDVALAFRDGAINFWRSYSPQLRSEGAPPNSIPYTVIFGLTGLLIESQQPQAMLGLSDDEAKLATRYAMHELNGFPSWLPSLFASHPNSVIEIVLNEIDYELTTPAEGAENSYVLYDVSWSGEWLWPALASLIIPYMRKKDRNISQLRQLLSIAQGSPLGDSELASLAARKARASTESVFAAVWFATWVGVAPRPGLAAVSAHLAAMTSAQEQTSFSTNFITTLVGGRFEKRCARQGFRTVPIMSDLFLLMQRYIREEEDINRANSGVYSPGERDAAQDARNALLSFIRETPGKDAFLALIHISQSHPVPSARQWIARQAKDKATLDSDSVPWTAAQLLEFQSGLERTPNNDRELWELAVDRLLDLKHDLEDSDTSNATILQKSNQETEIRNYIGGWLRDHAQNRYSAPQEEEFSDAKRADLRIHGHTFDGQIPVELKLADNWSGAQLQERLENQLCGDYMRDRRSSYGVFLLVYQGTRSRKSWTAPPNKQRLPFDKLADALQNAWVGFAHQFPNVNGIRVIGIDLTKRGVDAKTASLQRRSKTGK